MHVAYLMSYRICIAKDFELMEQTQEQKKMHSASNIDGIHCFFF